MENKNVKQKRFKELKKEIPLAKEIPLEILRQPKTTENEDIIPFVTRYNPNNPNIFPIIKQGFDNFQHSKTMSNIFQKKETC